MTRDDASQTIGLLLLTLAVLAFFGWLMVIADPSASCRQAGYDGAWRGVSGRTECYKSTGFQMHTREVPRW